MADMKPLYQYIGDPIACILPKDGDTDGELASDNVGVPILGMDGVLFIEILGATDATDVSQVQIQYSSTSAGSDAATSNAAWTCTDAVFTIHPHAEATGLVSMVDVRVGAKNFPDGAGHLFATTAAAESGSATICVIGIPYGGTRLLPATNAVTAINADSIA